MPTAPQILAALTELSRAWWQLAVGWHAYFIMLGVALALKWRPTRQAAGLLLIAPVVSVSALAWLSGNPFTASVFGAVLFAAVMICRRLPRATISIAGLPLMLVGVVLVLFGLAYPHFLEPGSTVRYLYAAPIGIVPCPTLSAIVGASIIVDSLTSRSWGLLVGAAGIFYGVFGAVHLGVNLDWVLFIGALILIATSWKHGFTNASRATAA